MRVVRVREKGPEPEGLRRVCYAYGCVDLTGAGLEPYLIQLSELGQYYSAVDTFHGSRGLWFDRSTRVNKKEISARGIGPDRSPCALLLLSSGAYDERFRVPTNTL